MTGRKVITEREIQRSARAGETSIDVTGAVVTPSARDAAVRAKIALTGGPASRQEPARRAVRGVRAAMCYDVTTAANAREHNNANVLTLGAGLIGPRLATAILDTFLATPFAGGRHKPRVDKIDALDRPG